MRAVGAWITTSMLCFPLFVAATHGQPAPAPQPCIIDGCPPATEWYTYRYNNRRTGVQPFASPLSDPRVVGEPGRLKVKWGHPRDDAGVGTFRASPIVVDDTVFIGNTNGYFYALDAAFGTLKWQYPQGNQALLGSCQYGGNGGWGKYGIYSSATFAIIRGQRAVIF